MAAHPEVLIEPASSSEIALRGDRRLVVVRDHDQDVVQVVNADGAVTLSIHITARGPILRFEGASMVLQTAGELVLDAAHLRLHGREGVSVTTEGDMAVRAAGALTTDARLQTINASHGDVRVTANDDVRLEGERVRMNC
jgi:uncharacterized protein (DUF2345 family)